MGANDSRYLSWYRKSKIGLRHVIKLDQLSCMISFSNPLIILIYLKNRTLQPNFALYVMIQGISVLGYFLLYTVYAKNCTVVSFPLSRALKVYPFSETISKTFSKKAVFCVRNGSVTPRDEGFAKQMQVLLLSR